MTCHTIWLDVYELASLAICEHIKIQLVTLPSGLRPPAKKSFELSLNPI